MSGRFHMVLRTAEERAKKVHPLVNSSGGTTRKNRKTSLARTGGKLLVVPSKSAKPKGSQSAGKVKPRKGSKKLDDPAITPNAITNAEWPRAKKKVGTKGSKASEKTTDARGAKASAEAKASRSETHAFGPYVHWKDEEGAAKLGAAPKTKKEDSGGSAESVASKGGRASRKGGGPKPERTVKNVGEGRSLEKIGDEVKGAPRKEARKNVKPVKVTSSVATGVAVTRKGSKKGKAKSVDEGEDMAK